MTWRCQACFNGMRASPAVSSQRWRPAHARHQKSGLHTRGLQHAFQALHVGLPLHMHSHEFAP
jgi:hypothetical protein